MYYFIELGEHLQEKEIKFEREREVWKTKLNQAIVEKNDAIEGRNSLVSFSFNQMH
jgi:hypothetical protein